MQKLQEGLSLRAAAALLALFYIGHMGIDHAGQGLGTDGWIAVLLGFVLSVPMLLIFSRLTRLMPGANLFEMLERGFGRRFSYVISVLYLAYFLFLAAMVLGQVEFIRTVSLPRTPLVVLLLFFFGAAVYFTHGGVPAMGKWSVLTIYILLSIFVLLSLLSIENMRVSNLLPIGTVGSGALFWSGYRVMVVPMGAGVVFLALIGRSAKWVSFYKVFFFGAGFAALFFVGTFLRDLAILGVSGMAGLTYPAYHAASGIQIGAGGGRVESLVTVSVSLSALIMLAVCLYAAACALRRVTVRRESRGMGIPAGILALGLTLFLGTAYARQLPLESWYLRYAPVVQAGIPLLLWAVLEVRVKRRGGAVSKVAEEKGE